MSHDFGNIDAWTKDKLDKVSKYLAAYLIALKNQNFTLEYIDAFAGTGYVTRKFSVARQSLFDEEEAIKLKDFIDGSARVALQTNPPFARYTFVEKHRKRCKELENLKSDFPRLSHAIEVVNAEANGYIEKICREDWIRARRRAVMFLDPYGTQVSWNTLKAIADTQAVDLWILFPIGTVNRLLNRNGRIIEGRVRRLNNMFGDELWFDSFYSKQENTSLFSTELQKRYIKTASFETIADYFVNRLKAIFADVAPNPFFMKNSSNSPMFLLCFAAGNPKGAPIAVKIAKHILGN